MNAMLDDPTSPRVTVASCRDFRPDVIVGVGGSCMNKAKLVSLLLTHGAPLDRDYGEFKVPGPVIPVVAILTTAGTGSEVTPVAVLGSWCLVSPSMESSILRRWLARLANEHFDLIEDSKSSGRS